MSRAIRRASPREMYQIGKLLEEYFDKDNRRYHDEWDDDRIAATVGGGVVASSVATARKSFGYTLQPQARVTIDAARIDKLERDADALRLAVTGMQTDLNRAVEHVTALYSGKAETLAKLRQRVARLEYLLDRIGNNLPLKNMTWQVIRVEALKRFGLNEEEEKA